MMRKFYLAKCLHENDWEAVRHDMEKRPINPPTTLAETIGEGNVDVYKRQGHTHAFENRTDHDALYLAIVPTLG